jgi:hypothetical protein
MGDVGMLFSDPVGQWYSIWGSRTPGGTRKRLTEYIKWEKIFRFKHWIIRARFRVSRRRPGRKNTNSFGGTKLKRNYIWGYANKNGWMPECHYSRPGENSILRVASVLQDRKEISTLFFEVVLISKMKFTVAKVARSNFLTFLWENTALHYMRNLIC